MSAALPECPPVAELPAIVANFRLLKPKQRKALAALQDTLVVTEACFKAKVPIRTFYGWLDNPNFKACFDTAMQNAVPQVEVAHFKAATGKDTLARIHILKNRHPAYREKALEVHHHDKASADLPSPAILSQLALVVAGAIRLLMPQPSQPEPKPVTYDLPSNTPLMTGPAQVIHEAGTTGQDKPVSD